MLARLHSAVLILFLLCCLLTFFSVRNCIAHATTLLHMKHGMVRLDNVWGSVGGGLRPVKVLEHEMTLLLQEYLSSGQVDEAMRCVRELEVPHFHHELVYLLVVMVLEDGKQQHAEQMAALLKELCSSVLVTPDQLEQVSICS